MGAESPADTCPHCGQRLAHDPKLGFRIVRLMHLVKHAAEAATGVTSDDFPDRPYEDAALSADVDTWYVAAYAAHHEVIWLFDSDNDPSAEPLEKKALQWLEDNYPGNQDIFNRS